MDFKRKERERELLLAFKGLEEIGGKSEKTNSILFEGKKGEKGFLKFIFLSQATE